ncbi:hypothetical protein F5B18DRAFT_661070 [Nemania serpens]|nr:hypothetical protein F5B18DRAFT_661070 [Nemania serpens]
MYAASWDCVIVVLCLFLLSVVSKISTSASLPFVSRAPHRNNPSAIALSESERSSSPLVHARGGVARTERPALTALAASSGLQFRFRDKLRTETQVLDGNQLRKLALTLGRRSLYPGVEVAARPPADGTLVPPGYHLVYFTPGDVEENLGADGSHAMYDSLAPFTRVKWTGGRMRWVDESDGGSPLRVGDEVEERTKLVKTVPQKGTNGTERILMDVVKEFWGPKGLALVDERTFIIRPEMTNSSPAAEKRLKDVVVRGPSTMAFVSNKGVKSAYMSCRRRWSPTGLFRFSALTFNSHRIHYDPSWAAAMEGHEGCVVHEQLNLICMLDYWRDVCAAKKGHSIRQFSYRTSDPIYAGETYEIGTDSEKRDDQGVSWEISVRKQGKLCMIGTVLGV